ncbi:unnamed protein product, partial [Mesorhabditis belari]|uniref:Uncharacterized protein n=1 Tax=Mesorhabditis belari TaxID=2138241 RepID=A0AAF3F997_9BILA
MEPKESREKIALRGTLRELLTRYTKTNENRVLSIAIHFDKAEKKTGAKSTAIEGLSAPEECAATFRAELLPLKPLRGVDENNADDN